MDPLNALSIAASVIQFVQFSSKILSGAVKIYRASEGVSTQSQHLSNVYTQLSQLTSSLQKKVCADASTSRVPIVNHSCYSAIVQLGKDCQEDCDRLLGIVCQLQIGRTNGRWWKSFQVALREHLKSEEISQLQNRIENYETTIMMHLCTISSQHCITLGRDISNMNSSWASHIQSYQYDVNQLKTSLGNIESRVTEMIRQNRYVIDKMDVDLLTSKLVTLSMETGLLKRSDDILKSLDYEQRHSRHEAIPLAHKETFQWAFHQRQSSRAASPGFDEGEGDFSRWLQESDDTFWISGKPGSGKSTLMKFLAGHEFTQCMLDHSPWSASKVVVASHYFWSAGTAIQRSQQGLWRSILYDVLRKDPRMIPQVCLERCGSTEADSCHQPWSLRELLDCIQALAHQEGSATKFCIFVDGLDEFEGDPLDLIQPLQALSKSRLVKLCVASRPWNAFEQAFGNFPDLKIYVHDLTAKDIRAFTSERLKSHPNWGKFASEEDLTSIVREVTERSRGVFFWVYLVTKELREGLSNLDTVADLKRRLNRMPSELVPFFVHILDSVDSFYRGRTAETLRIPLAAEEVTNAYSMPCSIYYFHDREYDEPGFALRMPTNPQFEPRIAKQMRQRVHYRLNGICKGLLELNGDSVGYLHRTVKDWLTDPAMQQCLQEQSSPTFNPYGAILSAWLAVLKGTRFTDTILISTHELAHKWHGKLCNRLREMLSYVPYAGNAEKRTDSVRTFETINCLGKAVEELFAMNGAHFSPWISSPARIPRMMFRQILLEARLWHYIARKLQDEPGFFEQYPATPFYAILKDDSLTRHSRIIWTQELAESVYSVLADDQVVASGCGDDCACADRVIWTLMVRDCLPGNILNTETKPTAENLVSFTSALGFGIMSTMASRLEPSAEICVARTGLVSVPAWFGLILLLLKCEELSGQQKKEFLQILEEMLRWPTTDFCCLMNSADDSGTTLADVLCRHLQYHMEFAERQSGAQEGFLAGIVCLILANVEKQSAALDQLAPMRELLRSTIANCFPQKSAGYLLSIYGPVEETVTTEQEVNKKRREAHDQAIGGPLRKRGKWLINK